MRATTPDQRDIDIRIASSMDAYVQDKGDFFVLTGSYSIDALTGADVKHNDIDSNIFTTNIPIAMGRVAAILESHEPSMQLMKQTGDRLEYAHPHRYGSTQVEMQFVRYDDLRQGTHSIDFVLPSTSSHSVIVPTVVASLKSEAEGYEHQFTVKSLPFAIATWALRISNVALNQKRPVRDSDIRHFAFLAAMPHDKSEIEEAIQHHPQMPDNYAAAADVLNESYAVLKKRDGE